MEASINLWKNSSLKGTLNRIFKEEVHGPLRVLISPNNIGVVLLDPKSSYQFVEKTLNKKILKNLDFIVVDGHKASLPFDFVLKEVSEDAKEEYAAIIHKR
ncbi:uncharacterized protein Eint_101510 [Encephalitozoon intestinalis ATCC 50506]|uniref:Uncharacterized protein n=1 Tax=Encephalitozoon intestinalis (strain ATCC 50506) TaxID=876142 RepID=E0S9U1_ENCIT|nr:uncharacterized protein Eint_101510 [Encephalitozoon intestinalis ATCC 50506]ADM12476.1 hypothetical protein Eint_101510 [Encephalitozoon intestinalis ATCC 50506]UTX46313.1 hypothetical protein GPK93_10g19130 [Encephalitozoon intestinalis]